MYQGLFGMYQIVDPKTEVPQGIPTDPRYDIPLLFTSHYFSASGALTDESRERASIYGDTWLANGAICPHLDVEPRKYRFRILNAAVSRTLNLTLERDGGRRGSGVDMAVVASDGGIRPFPVVTRSLVIGMGERWEVRMPSLKNCLFRDTNCLDCRGFRTPRREDHSRSHCQHVVR
jgi:bilirubin oxidase